MDGVNEPDENSKISNLLDPDAEKQTFLDESRKTSQTSGTKMRFTKKNYLSKLHIHQEP
ncbi:hypothetical protein Hanom_Chr10g00961221 [Helianthus anomalus]